MAGGGNSGEGPGASIVIPCGLQCKLRRGLSSSCRIKEQSSRVLHSRVRVPGSLHSDDAFEGMDGAGCPEYQWQVFI